MRRKKQKKIEKVIISLYKASREASLEMLSTILGTSLKMDKRNQCKEQTTTTKSSADNKKV